MNLFFQTLFTSPISDFVLIVDFFWYQLFYPYLFSFGIFDSLKGAIDSFISFQWDRKCDVYYKIYFL